MLCAGYHEKYSLDQADDTPLTRQRELTHTNQELQRVRVRTGAR